MLLRKENIAQEDPFKGMPSFLIPSLLLNTFFSKIYTFVHAFKSRKVASSSNSNDDRNIDKLCYASKKSCVVKIITLEHVFK